MATGRPGANLDPVAPLVVVALPQGGNNVSKVLKKTSFGQLIVGQGPVATLQPWVMEHSVRDPPMKPRPAMLLNNARVSFLHQTYMCLQDFSELLSNSEKKLNYLVQQKIIKKNPSQCSHCKK